jgi:hypothetical protein
VNRKLTKTQRAAVIRWRGCVRKGRYFSDEEAAAARDEANRRWPDKVHRVYRCKICRHRHLTTQAKRVPTDSMGWWQRADTGGETP